MMAPYGGSIAQIMAGKSFQTACPKPNRNKQSTPTAVWQPKALEAVYDAADGLMRDLMDLAYITGQRPIDVVGIHSSHIHEALNPHPERKQNESENEIIRI